MVEEELSWQATSLAGANQFFSDEVLVILMVTLVGEGDCGVILSDICCCGQNGF